VQLNNNVGGCGHDMQPEYGSSEKEGEPKRERGIKGNYLEDGCTGRGREVELK